MPDVNLPSAAADPDGQPGSRRSTARTAVRVGRGALPNDSNDNSAESDTTSTGTAGSLAALTKLSALVAVPAEEGSDQIAVALEMVCTMVAGAQWVTWTAATPSGTMRTLHASHSDARAADELQFQLHEGPTVEVIRHRLPVLVETVRGDPRWPRFARILAARTPVAGILSVPVDVVRQDHATLTLYGGPDHRFGDDATAATAAVAGTALAGLAQRERAANLHRALLSNRRIGVAIGILMALHHWTEDQAFQALTAASQASNRKISDLAEEVTHTGALPTT